MALILNIDTATEYASVCISNNDEILSTTYNDDQKSHASFIQPAIHKVLEGSGNTFSQIDAVAVTAGPGSYTGLRVGLATAKGICYALQKPLIMCNTLQVMALTSMDVFKKNNNLEPDILFCPMIDARRMEVFTAIYNVSNEAVLEPCAIILTKDKLLPFIKKNKVVFSGSGSEKFQSIEKNENCIFVNIQYLNENLARLAYLLWKEKKFAELAYCEPFYLKEFFTNSPLS